MNKEHSGVSKEKLRELLGTRMTRRSLLGGCGVIGLAKMANGEGQILAEETGDFLSDQELAENNIEIYSTGDTQLFLRRSVFEIPLFGDVREGKLGGVVISLVDNEIVPFSGHGIGSSEAKLVWQTGVSGYLRKYLTINRSWLAKHLSVNARSREFWADQLDREEDFERRSDYKRRLEAAQEMGKNIKKELEELGSPSWLVQNGPRGAFTTTKAIESENAGFSQQHPDFGNKAYIFMAVGGGAKPKPFDSWPNPEEIAKATQADYLYSSNKAGFALRHEVFHYDPSGQKNANSERDADGLAFESLVFAWHKFRENGDTTGYYFVFKTDEGLIITKRPHSSAQNSQLRKMREVCGMGEALL